MIDVDKKYAPITDSDSRYFIVTGGRGSGKSYSINLLLVLLTYEAEAENITTDQIIAQVFESVEVP